MPGKARRRLYKPERKAARTKGVIAAEGMPPLACPDAHPKEVAMALFAIAREAKVAIGRAAGYDNLRDEYTVVGKSMLTGKAQDFTIKGDEVAVAIELFRMANGGRVTEPNRRMRRAARAVGL